MKALILGPSGKTGKLVVQQLIRRDIQVRLVMRASAAIPENFTNDKRIEITKGNVSDFDIAKITELVKDCDSVICCLGHNISLKGIFGPPYKLVSNTVRKITEALHSLKLNQKFILMSTTAYTNKTIGEKNSPGKKIIFSLLKVLLPPHRDNMLAADQLVHKLGSNSGIEWVAVRPDSLIDVEVESEYELHNHKIRSPLSNPGKTSRINASHLMAELVINDKLWQEWKHKTPVIYNKE
jgi:nucleoside-diphosphate-sugar epimerase